GKKLCSVNSGYVFHSFKSFYATSPYELEKIAQCTNLTSLDLFYPESDRNSYPYGNTYYFHLAILGIVSNLTELTSLNLSGAVHISDDMASAIGNLTHLKHLQVAKVPCYNPEIFLQELAKLANLESLDLKGCDWVKGELATELMNLTQLKKLEL